MLKADRTTHAFKPSCGACALGRACLPGAVDAREASVLGDLMKRGPAVARGEYVYRAGDPFTYLYVVRSGALKSVRVTRDGEEQIVALHLPGDLFGLDGPAQPRHDSAVVAMETSYLCEIPYATVSQRFQALPGLYAHLLKTMSRELSKERDIVPLLGRRSAEQRIAAFLCLLSSRLALRGSSPEAFRLPMSTTEMASYLGVAIETASRVLMRLHRYGVIRKRARHIGIPDPQRLRAIADGPD